MRIGDQTLNRLGVLKAIRRHGPVSRSELPALTQLSGATITQLTGDLLARGLVRETKDVDKRRGRPRVNLEINADGGIVVGVSVAGTGLLATRFVNLLGEPLFAYDVRLSAAQTLWDFVQKIAAGVAAAIEASPFQRAELTRIGLSLPGLINSARGTVHFVTSFAEDVVPAAEILSEATGLPATIENTQACSARALHWFGPAAEIDTFTMVDIGYAVGTAEYLDGLPQSGANGLNPEFGHVKTAFGAGARRCFCGASGCVSAYSSIYGILGQTDLLFDVEFPSLGKMSDRFDEFLCRAERGDAEAVLLLRQASEHLAVAIGNHLTATDPGHVLISVSSRRFISQLKPHFWEVLRESAFPGVLKFTQVQFIVASYSAWRRGGMAALALEQTYLDDGSYQTKGQIAQSAAEVSERDATDIIVPQRAR